jgi:Zn-dependent protease
MTLIFILIILIFSVAVHEVAHAWVARREGDDTADKLGRITLNPMSHLDLMGSLIVPVSMYYMSGGMIFGWAKPVPVNPRNFRDPRWSDIRVSMAGIVSNLILAVGFTLLAGGFVLVQGIAPGLDGVLGQGLMFARFGVYINLILAVFNLIPIPPLDGSHVLAQLLPRKLSESYRRLGRFGGVALLGLIFFVPQFFTVIQVPVEVLMGLADRFIGLWI